MSKPPQMFDRVALMRSMPEAGLERGDVGTIVEAYDSRAYEVEFVGPDGRTRALVRVPVGDCLPLHLEPQPPAVSGVIDRSFWYWYDPATDLLELRLLSKRGVHGEAAATPDGLTVIRESVSGQALGLVVGGFWQRFGGQPIPPLRDELERRIRTLSPRLTAA